MTLSGALTESACRAAVAVMPDHRNDSLSGIYYHDLLTLFFCLPPIILQTIHPVKIQVPSFVTGVLRVTGMTHKHNSQDDLLPQLLLVHISIILCPLVLGMASWAWFFPGECSAPGPCSVIPSHFLTENTAHSRCYSIQLSPPLILEELGSRCLHQGRTGEAQTSPDSASWGGRP